MHPKEISIRDYTYDLPEKKIAKYPVGIRDASRLLVYSNGIIREDIYRNISDHLPEGAMLIFNNSKVVEARILFQKPTGGIIEIFCLEPADQDADVTTAMAQKGGVTWKCLVGGASKWKRGQQLTKKIISENDITLNATYLKQEHGSFIIQLSWQPADLSFAGVLHHAGVVPLPPYLKREVEISDEERYQTIYASFDGSVAAPTAGLHFSEYIFETLRSKNIHTDFVTLHVGAGTFKPVKSETMELHDMHAEFIEVNKKTIENIISNLAGNIIAVGTTSLRTIESLYWLGVKIEAGTPQLAVGQWEAYDPEKKNVPVKDSLQSLLHRSLLHRVTNLKL